MKLFWLIPALLLIMSIPGAALSADDSAQPETPFTDIPAGHWAMDAVKELTDKGIVQGYPGSEFKGNQPITRYELAVTLARFVEIMAPPKKDAAQPAAKDVSCEAKAPDWAAASIEMLKKGNFLPAESPIMTDGKKAATAEDVSQALAAVAARLIELRVPPEATDDK